MKGFFPTLWVAILVRRQHACPEQLQASSAIHCTLDCLQADDLAFRLAVAPGQLNGVVDGVKIAVQDACEPLNCDQTRVNGIVNPAVEPVRIAAAKIPQKRMPRLRIKTNSGEP
ncbi:hypothetical protein BG46_06420 [Brucella anthropi]|nr:hypothetical protein BG46_06420 [Brucella anthropi]